MTIEKHLPKTRKDAIKQGSKFYLGSACKHGHYEGRHTLTATCIVCAREIRKKRHRQRLKEDPEYRKRIYAKSTERRRRKRRQEK